MSKFPLSVNNKQCIGPCHAKNVWVTHPITLDQSRPTDINQCPVMGYYNEDKQKYMFFDQCNAATVAHTDSDLTHLLIPNSKFDCNLFLKRFYKITSFSDAIEWLTKQTNPINTQLRVMNCTLRVYCRDTDIVDNQIIDFYIDAVKKTWINDIYKHIYKYITVDGKNIGFKENNDKSQVNKVEKINYFLKKMITPQNMYDVLTNYIKNNLPKWKSITDHNIGIKNELIDFVYDKIKNYS